MTQPPPPPPPGPPYGQPPLPPYVVPGSAHGYPPNGDERTWAWLCHASFFVIGLVGPLIVLLTKGNESPFVRRHAVEALNFHISLLVYSIVSVVLILVIVGIFTLLATFFLGLVCTIMAIVAAAGGREYRYPLCLRLVS